MSKKKAKWVRVKPLSKEEKAAIAAISDRFIDAVLKPCFLPDIRPTEFNYPVDIFCKWRGSKYSFITRYRSGFPENSGEEFDAPFTRLDHVEERFDETLFNAMWRRHTGQWWLLQSAVTLNEALRLIETEPMLQPIS